VKNSWPRRDPGGRETAETIQPLGSFGSLPSPAAFHLALFPRPTKRAAAVQPVSFCAFTSNVYLAALAMRAGRLRSCLSASGASADHSYLARSFAPFVPAARRRCAELTRRCEQRKRKMGKDPRTRQWCTAITGLLHIPASFRRSVGISFLCFLCLSLSASLAAYLAVSRSFLFPRTPPLIFESARPARSYLPRLAGYIRPCSSGPSIDTIASSDGCYTYPDSRARIPSTDSSVDMSQRTSEGRVTPLRTKKRASEWRWLTSLAALSATIYD
jgi:hypothetical protein